MILLFPSKKKPIQYKTIEEQSPADLTEVITV